MTGRRPFLLLACAAVLLGLTALGLYQQRQDDIDRFVMVAMAQAIVYLISVGLVWNRQTSWRALVAILAVAALLRLPILCAPPYLSSDIYRYVWDGRVEGAGINPYRYIPISPHLDRLRDLQIFPHINRSTYARTIYPPAAEGIFFVVTRISGSLIAMKAAMVVIRSHYHRRPVAIAQTPPACPPDIFSFTLGIRCRSGSLPAAAISTPP